MGQAFNTIYYYFYDKPLNKNISQIDMNIINMKMTRDKIKEKIHNYEFKENSYKVLAKKYLKEGNKTKAKFYIQRSKIYKIQNESTLSILLKIMEQLNMIETAKIQADACKILEEGNLLLKNMQINVEKFEEIREDMDEIKQNHNDIRDFLIGVNYENDFDDEISKELSALENECNKPDPIPHINNIENVHSHSLEEMSKSKIISNIVEDKKIEKEWEVI